jgi:Uma2 family endonuclease
LNRDEKGPAMNQASRKTVRAERKRRPTWEVAHFFPRQGEWDEEEYLALDTNWLIELRDGCLEVLPMPTTSHQLMALYLYGQLLAFVTNRHLGMVLAAPLPVRLRKGEIREPDVLFMHKDHAERIGEQFWKGADLVMEVVSGSKKDRERDLVEKRRDYARAGISEYWIIDPREETITVLRLSGKRYVYGAFGKGTTATSHLLPGFSVDVTEVFARRLPPTKRTTNSKRRSR